MKLDNFFISTKFLFGTYYVKHSNLVSFLSYRFFLFCQFQTLFVCFICLLFLSLMFIESDKIFRPVIWSWLWLKGCNIWAMTMTQRQMINRSVMYPSVLFFILTASQVVRWSRRKAIPSGLRFTQYKVHLRLFQFVDY